MLDLLIDLGWKSALISGLALSASWLLRSRAAGERVLLLRVALAALLALPVFALLVPALELPMLPAEPALPAADSIPAIDLVAPTPGAAPVEAPFDPVPLFYAAGALLIVARLAAGLWTLSAWTRSAVPVGEGRWSQAVAHASARLRHPVRLRVSPRVAAPMSWGIAPAWVLIDPALEQRDDQAEAVIAHEMAHVCRFDWPVLVASQLATALFWFNPLVWLLGRELARQTELAADDEAIRHVTRADYAQTLLSVAGPAGAHAACSMAATGGALAQRIRRVLEDGAPRQTSRLVAGLLLIGAPAIVVPLAVARIVPAGAIPLVTVETERPAPARSVMRPDRDRPTGSPERRAERLARIAEPAQAPEAAAPVRPREPKPEVELDRSPAALAAETARTEAADEAAIERISETLATKMAERLSRVPQRGGPFGLPRTPPLQAAAPVPSPTPPAPARQDQDSEDEASSEPQGASRLQRMRRWISRLRSEADRLENAARYYPDSSDVRTAYIKAASDARRQAQMLERNMQKLNPGQ
jgi:Zn-dependent protease with chaperone function